MRVPLEILRIILDHATTDHSKEQLLNLRFVSRTFDAEVLSYFFSNKRFTRPFAGHRWLATPVRLRERYLRFRTTQHRAECGLWTQLFVPVFERQLAELGIRGSDCEAWRAKLEVSLQLSTHHHWNLGWVIIDRRDALSEKTIRHLSHFEMSQEFTHHALDNASYITNTVRVENDLKFMRILSAIVEDDVEAVIEQFPGSYIAVDDMNPCFGTTLLGFVIQYCTLAMLEILLLSTDCVRRRHLYLYIRLSQARHGDSNIFIDTLLNKVSGFDTCKKVFTTELLEKAISTNNHVLFDTVIRWFVDAPGFPGKLRVLEWCFDTLIHG